MMRRLCARYQQAVNQKDLAAVEALFVPGAVIEAPIRGKVSVTDFHAYMFEHVKRGTARFTGVFNEKTNPPRISLRFGYTFLTQSVTLAGVDGVATFEYDDRSGRFRHLKIAYDADVIRRLLELENIALPGKGAAP